MLARGELIAAVLASVLGSCSAGRAAQAMWLAFLSSIPTLGVRRRVLEHFLRTFEGAERHGSQWRVIGAAGFVGRDHERVPRAPVERVDPDTGEYSYQRPRGYPSDPERRHCPSESAGGIAAHSGRSPHTLRRYRAEMRRGQLIGSEQPPYDAPDAVRPRRGDGRWAYAQLWLRMPPTPEMIRRWRGRTAAPLRELARRAQDVPAHPRADDLRALSERVELDPELERYCY